ncbi:MAG TPA: FG-GAP-like repeat-containing protein [Chryseolinea sp.]|nr:FG-GAP-like repeat-containing protein [Chryseolinea sp.]HPM29543.1 FG-GAP-like repeat-containing protein [Chryseolinea sp.]
MRRIVLLLALLFPTALQAQFTYVLDQTIPVKDLNGNTLDLAWAGGLNAAQYNTIDLNSDGKDDLALFDRMANKVITFLNDNNQYRYAPEYEMLFPEEVTNWLLLRDYNCDGKKDIFTGDVFGMKVYTNTTEPGENLSWKPFLFYVGPGSSKSEALLTLGFSGKVNLQLQYDDLPAIVDADGDGDLDIFNMRYQGDGTMEFHKNFSKERYGTCDSLDFERQTQNWGGFKECQCGEFAFNNEDCPPSSPDGGRTKHAGGKSLLIMDTDGDADLDVLFSEASCNNLYLLKNDGNITSPIINSSTPFPTSNPIDFVIFPSAFYEDLDFDGTKDLISSPNIYSRAYFESALDKSNWFYKNNGSTSNPSFTLTEKDFLQDRMVEVGDNAVPAFVDYDGDGDYDLFISQYISEDFSSTIHLYNNTGTSTDPEFTLIDEDYLSFSALLLFNLKIQFADMNGDSKTDLVFTASSLNTAGTKLFYVANKSNSVFDFSNQTPLLVDFTFMSTENILITDVGLDGLNDILIGRSNGALQYWKNNGPAGSQNYSLVNAEYLGLGSSVLRQNLTTAVGDLDADGKSDLILGNQYGQITIVPDFRNASNLNDAVIEIIFNPINTTYNTQNLGGRIWPTITYIFNSNRPDIVVGTILGGVRLLRNDGSMELPKNPVIKIYPIPVSQEDMLTIIPDRAVLMQVYSSIGQEIGESIRIDGNELFPFNVSRLSPGMYILQFSVNNTFVAKRIIVY